MTNNTRMTPDKVGRTATKVVAEAAYVITGMADVVVGTVQDVVKQGRSTYTDRRAAGESPVKNYAKQVPDHMKELAGEVKEAYATLSARGRTVFKEGFSSTAHRPVSSTDQRPLDDVHQSPAD